MYKIDDTLKMYHIDINMTRLCNLDCDYCFEPTEIGSISEDFVEEFIKWINKFLASDFFINNYDMLNINFWGGEPTLKAVELMNIINAFYDNEKVKFFIFSNGYNISELKTFLNGHKKDKALGNHPKICIQISYDGYVIHNKHRVNKKGEDTSKDVVDTIKWLNSNEIPYVIKSVITPEDFKYMIYAYDDIKYHTYENNPSFFKSQNYNPTIEYFTSEIYSESEIEIFIKDLRNSLIKLVARELVYIKEKGHRPFFSWLHKNIALCSAGQHYIAVDYDGNVYPCHGCLYLNKDEHFITNIKQDASIENIAKISKVFQKNNKYIPNTCKECDADFCMKCNVTKYELSKKQDYFEKWRDYDNQETLCRYFKEIGKFIKIFRSKLDLGGQ